MLRSLRRQLPATIIASLALFVALGGPAEAGRLIHGKEIKKNTVASAQIKNGSVTGTDVKDSSLTGTDVKDSTLTGADVRDATLTGADVRDGSLTSADLRAGQLAQVIPGKRVAATPGADLDAARAAAPEHLLFRKGALSLTAKCYTSAADEQTYYEVLIGTGRDGAVFSSREAELRGGPLSEDFLNRTTPLNDRIVEEGETSDGFADSGAEDSSDFTAFAPDGTAMRGFVGGFVKHGALSEGNGVYGAGNVCLFTGMVAAS